MIPALRPQAVRLVSGVGSEEVEFEPIIPLEGKVEIYMQVTDVDIRVVRFMCSAPPCRLTCRSSSIAATLLPNPSVLYHTISSNTWFPLQLLLKL